ncbi:MAG: hypothetical protein HYZ53_09110 [Planctomycetes bacterium]|nr:hypothetical protein [Planctomycetota bacterium]
MMWKSSVWNVLGVDRMFLFLSLITMTLCWWGLTARLGRHPAESALYAVAPWVLIYLATRAFRLVVYRRNRATLVRLEEDMLSVFFARGAPVAFSLRRATYASHKLEPEGVVWRFTFPEGTLVLPHIGFSQAQWSRLSHQLEEWLRAARVPLDYDGWQHYSRG